MNICSRKNFVAAAVALALSAGSALANEPAEAPSGTLSPEATHPPADPMQSPPSVQAEVSDEKLRQFVTAAEDVHKIQQDYAVKAQSLQQAAEEEIVSSVQEAGMTVEEFTELVARVQNDPELARRLDDLQTP